MKDSATIAADVPMDAVVDWIRVDGCDPEGEQLPALDDSTFDVVTAMMFLARDIDGRPGTDYVIRENRPLRGTRGMLTFRVAVYFDSIPASRTPAWATPWNDEMSSELDAGDVVALRPSGSLVVLGGSYADYGSETLLVVRDGTVSVGATHVEDYGRGYLEFATQGGKVVVDASLAHLELRGKAVAPELQCGAGQWRPCA